MTQRERVLKALEDAGSVGITPVDFTGPDVVDGGSPILRVAPRIDELRKQGYRISTYRQPNGVARYVLIPVSEGFEMPAGEGDGRDGYVTGGRLRASESPVREGQHSEVVVTAGTADLPSEGLFDTDQFRPAPEYPS